MPGMKLFTLKTPDKNAYLEWLKDSGPKIGNAIKASSIGVCFPDAGAPELNTVYLFRMAESMTNLLDVDPSNPVIAEEFSKANFEWEITTADYWDWLIKPEKWPWTKLDEIVVATSEDPKNDKFDKSKRLVFSFSINNLPITSYISTLISNLVSIVIKFLVGLG